MFQFLIIRDKYKIYIKILLAEVSFHSIPEYIIELIFIQFWNMSYAQIVFSTHLFSHGYYFWVKEIV